MSFKSGPEWHSLVGPNLASSAYVVAVKTDMAANTERNPPPFLGSEDQDPLSEMGDGDSDDGQDIFLGNVSTQ